MENRSLIPLQAETTIDTIEANYRIIPVAAFPSLETIIEDWLAEKKRKSIRTYEAYSATMKSFRGYLALIGLDLLASQWQDVLKAAQTFVTLKSDSTQSRAKGEISIATQNQRGAILRSFYAYAVDMGYCEKNPLTRLKSQQASNDHAAMPIEKTVISEGMKAIDTSTLAGKRDKAMLAMLLTTGRRVSEVRTLTWNKVIVKTGLLTCKFICKGKKTIEDTLDAKTEALLQAYKAALLADMASKGKVLSEESNVFISLSKNNYGGELSIQAISDICKKYLGESRVHATRHTTAVTLELQGASLYEVSKQLGHSNMAITSRYMEKIKPVINPYAEKLANAFGF